MGKVKRASSAWIFYTSENRKAFQAKNPDAKMTELTKIMGDAWGKLSAAEKKKYEDMAAKDKERFTKEKAEASSESSDDEDTKGKRKGKRGSKAKKDPDAPKRPASAWILYLNDHRDAERKKSENDGKKITEITTIISGKWAKESDAAKAKYQKQADALKEKYTKAKAEYDAKKKDAGSDSDDSSDEKPKKRAKKGSGKKKAASESDSE